MKKRIPSISAFCVGDVGPLPNELTAMQAERNPNRGAWKAKQRLGMVVAQRRVDAARERLNSQEPSVLDSPTLGLIEALLGQLWGGLVIQSWAPQEALDLVAEAYLLGLELKGRAGG